MDRLSEQFLKDMGASEAKEATETQPAKETKQEATPAVEAKEQPTEKPKDNKKEEETQPSSLKDEPKSEPTQDDFDTRFTERLQQDGYVSKSEYEELKGKLETPPTQNELIQRMIELEKNGVAIDKNTLPQLFENFDKYDINKSQDALNVMRRKLRNELGDDEMAEFKIKKSYGALFDEDPDSEEYQDALMSLKIDSKKALQEFKEQQDKLSIPDPSKKLTTKEEVLQEINKEAETQREKLRNAFTQLAEDATKDFSKVSYDIKGNQVEVEIDPEVKRSVKKEIKNLDTFFDRNFMDEKGNINTQGIAEFMHLWLNKDKVYGIIADNFMSQGEEKQVKELKNSSSEGQKSSATDAEPTLAGQLAEQMAKQGLRIY